MKYPIITIILILIILCFPSNYIVSSICAGIYFLGQIGYELEKLTKQKKESSEQLTRTIEASIMELKNTMIELKNK